MNCSSPFCFDLLGSDSVAVACGHTFHKNCAFNWIDHSTVCPQCRQKISRSTLTELHFKDSPSYAEIRSELQAKNVELRRKNLELAFIQARLQGAREHAANMQKAHQQLQQKYAISEWGEKGRLLSKRQELEEIKNMLTYLFKSVFVHHFRDTLPEIRSICMYEIGQWIKKFHRQFLDDSYLKYIGWTLHDEVGDTQLKCLQAPLPLYGAEELTSKIVLFTNKFKDRIVLTLDKEHDIIVHGVKPSLLAECLADAEKIANLMLIPQYFELEIYTTSRQEKNLDSLLKLIHEIVERHNDTDVLEACAKTYEVLCNEELAIHSRCAVARDSLVHKYKQASSDFMQAGEEIDKIFTVTSAMKKVSIFYSCHNLGPWSIWDNIYDFWVKGAIQDKGSPEEVAKYAMLSCSMGIMWDLASLDDTSPLPVNMQFAENSRLTPLVYEPDWALQTLLSSFVQKKRHLMVAIIKSKRAIEFTSNSTSYTATNAMDNVSSRN